MDRFIVIVDTLAGNFSFWKSDSGWRCPKHNVNLCMKSEPSMAGADAIANFVYIYLAQKPDIYRCICSNSDRLNF